VGCVGDLDGGAVEACKLLEEISQDRQGIGGM
jgi:hypothetical protein